MSLFVHNYFNIFKRTTRVPKVTTTIKVEIPSDSSSSSFSNTNTNSNIPCQANVQKRSEDNTEMVVDRRIVTFHPCVVTVIHERPSTPTEEKENLYFSRQELQQYRNEEKAQMFEKEKLISLIKSQEKYQKKGKGFQQGSVTKVTFKCANDTLRIATKFEKVKSTDQKL